jgi:hypothetical protein
MQTSQGRRRDASLGACLEGCTQFNRCGSGLGSRWGLRPRWSSGGYGVQRRCDLRGAAAAGAYFQDVAGAGDILLGLEAPEAVERLVPV